MILKKIIPHNFRDFLIYSLSFLPDEPYLKLFYYVSTGKILNLKNPKTFEDKQHWLKLHDQHMEYSMLVDKIRVREHIKKTIGEEYLFPLLGAWRSFDEIDLHQLPNQFVLKCNHDSGSVKIIENKNEITRKEWDRLSKFYKYRLSKNFFYAGREYPYKNVIPYIIAEPLMISNVGDGSLIDYKFFCFEGVPKLVQVMTNRKTDFRIDWYDMNFNHLQIISDHPQSDEENSKPSTFEDMKIIAKILSEGIKFVRIDLYEYNSKIYFGEYTFFHGGGFQFLQPDEWEYRMGSWIELPNNHI